MSKNKSLISTCVEAGPAAHKVRELFISILSITGLKDRIAYSVSVEVQAQNWTIRECRLDSTSLTMAYDGRNTRCLAITCEGEQPLSVLADDIDVVEARFVQWAQALIDAYIEDTLDGKHS
jgi:hypothetical protein